MSAITKVYSKSFLNATLSKWMDVTIPAPSLDCHGCQKLTKCCAFQPFVPNFLLGGWLQQGQELPEVANVDFYPMGAIPTFSYREKHRQTQNHGLEFLCGFFEPQTRGCNLWSFRPGECSTYFCDEAQTTNQRMEISEKSFALEVAVAQMALVQLGFSHLEISSQVDAVNGAKVEAQKYSGTDLLIMYKKSWQWCRTLEKDTIQSWLGIG